MDGKVVSADVCGRVVGHSAEVLEAECGIEEHFGPTVQPNEPRGGIFLWVRFPHGVDTRKALEAAREEGVAYNPGPDWAVYDSDDDLNGHNYVRLC